jgi:hypothetical protein
MSAHDDFRDCLERGDLAALRRHWQETFPNMPQPKNDTEAEIVMHHARTQSIMVGFMARAYSHRWLCERGLPSGLPDQLKPKAERIYPRIVSAVGVSCNSKVPGLADAVEAAMSAAVAECYANRESDPVLIKERMMAARSKTKKMLMGAGYG